MRTIGSISSDLCEMQRLRDSNIALSAKDLEWQRHIAAAASAAATITTSPSHADQYVSPPPPTATTTALPFTLGSTMMTTAPPPPPQPQVHHAHHAPHTHHALLQQTLSPQPAAPPSPHAAFSRPAPDLTPFAASSPFAMTAAAIAAATAANTTASKPPLPGAVPAPSLMVMTTSPTSNSFLQRTAPAMPPFSANMSPSLAATSPAVFSPQRQWVTVQMPGAAQTQMQIPKTEAAIAAHTQGQMMSHGQSAPAVAAIPVALAPASAAMPATVLPQVQIQAQTQVQTGGDGTASTAAAPKRRDNTSPSSAISSNPSSSTTHGGSPHTIAESGEQGAGDGTAKMELTMELPRDSTAKTLRRRQATPIAPSTTRPTAKGQTQSQMQSPSLSQHQVMTETETTSTDSLDDSKRTVGHGATSVQKSIGKIRRHRMTKQEEARFNPKDLVDLTGSTAAKSRKMSDQERDIMLHKRRLRNRASAARSRDKQRKTINDLSDELEELFHQSQQVLQKCQNAERRITQLQKENEALVKENKDLKKQNSSVCVAPTQVTASPPQVLKRTASTLRFSMSTDMLDKLMSTSNDSPANTSRPNGMVKMPSKLHVSLSTDKLSDGNFPFISGPLPPLSRNVSVMERLIDLANTNGGLDLNCDVQVKE